MFLFGENTLVLSMGAVRTLSGCHPSEKFDRCRLATACASGVETTWSAFAPPEGARGQGGVGPDLAHLRPGRIAQVCSGLAVPSVGIFRFFRLVQV